MPVLDKDSPSPAAIAALRARFACEAEIDRVLTRKLALRAVRGLCHAESRRLVAGSAS